MSLDADPVMLRVRRGQDIRHLPDVPAASRHQSGAIPTDTPRPIRLEISLDETHPPSGTARIHSREPTQAFTGWLGLMESISSLLADATTDAGSDAAQAADADS